MSNATPYKPGGVQEPLVASLYYSPSAAAAEEMLSQDISVVVNLDTRGTRFIYFILFQAIHSFRF